MSDELTPEDLELIEQLGGNVGKHEEKQGIFSFFKKVISMPDTIRTSNLTNVELGEVTLSVRTLRNLSLFCKESGLLGLGEYFEKESKVISDSSLSRDGFLDKVVVTQRKATSMKTRDFSAAQKKKWFGGKKEEEDKEW
jgi:hypothetical protein